MAGPILSIVTVEYNMAREIERTIVSLSAAYQRDIGENDYEVILVDNGSSVPSDKTILRKTIPNIRIHAMGEASVSPVAALNVGLELARGDFVGASIDGARMFSPGVLSLAIQALRMHERGVVYPLGFHLGHAPQNLSRETGYNQSTEDALLNSVDWAEDGYRLFDIAVVAPGQAPGWFRPLAEATALFMSRSLWKELGGFDARFQSLGGGYVNLDTFARACTLPNVIPTVLLGEATFHQYHGGVASNATAKEHPSKRFHQEYMRIRGRPFEIPAYRPFCLGRVHDGFLRSIATTSDREKTRKSRNFLSPLRRLFGPG